MNLKEQLIHLATVFATYTDTRGRDGQITLSGISTKIFNDGKTLARVAEGGDVTTGSFERARQWFSDNWPEGALWPDNIPRPAPAPSSVEAA